MANDECENGIHASAGFTCAAFSLLCDFEKKVMGDVEAMKREKNIWIRRHLHVTTGHDEKYIVKLCIYLVSCDASIFLCINSTCI